MQSKLITITEIVAEYGIPRRTIEEAVMRRELNAYRLQGKTKYFKRVELDAWIESKLSNPPLLRSKHLKAAASPWKETATA